MDKSFKLSPYQEKILEYVQMYPNANLLVDAKAGSGKTSTLMLVQDALVKSGKKCLFLAFNKAIVEELDGKMGNNPNCMVKTVHSLGLTFIRSYLYRKHKENYEIKTEPSKLRNIIKPYYEKHCMEAIERDNALNGHLDESELSDLHSNLISDLVLLCNFTRFYNSNYRDARALEYLVDRFCRYLKNHKDVIDNYVDLVIYAIDETKRLFENPEFDEDGTPIYLIDYADMIYFPVYYKMPIPYSVRQYLDTILVDESQDLNVLQQLFLSRNLSTGFNRYIFVGDKYQAIYGFAGADTQSISNIKKNFNLTELPLNICYRCPMNVIKLAQTFVPTIEWNKSRDDDGVVELVTRDEMYKNLKSGDVIIGRKNRDLVKVFKHFALDLKKPVKFRNIELVNSLYNDIEEATQSYIKSYNNGNNIDVVVNTYMDNFETTTGFTPKTPEYKAEKKKMIGVALADMKRTNKPKFKSKHSLDNLLVCMDEYYTQGAYQYDSEDLQTSYFDVIAEFIEEYKKEHSSVLVKDFLKYVKDFLKGGLGDSFSPVISSIHTMKGGEADNVFILDFPMFPYKFGNQTQDDAQQEINLEYVAITRAKKNLYLVKLLERDEKTKARLDKNVELNEDAKSLICGIFRKQINDDVKII